MKKSLPSVRGQSVQPRNLPRVAAKVAAETSREQPDAAAGMRPGHRLSYSPAEAAGLLGVSRSTVNRLIACGELKSIRALGRRLIPAQSLEDLLSTKP